MSNRKAWDDNVSEGWRTFHRLALALPNHPTLWQSRCCPQSPWAGHCIASKPRPPEEAARRNPIATKIRATRLYGAGVGDRRHHRCDDGSAPLARETARSVGISSMCPRASRSTAWCCSRAPTTSLCICSRWEVTPTLRSWRPRGERSLKTQRDVQLRGIAVSGDIADSRAQGETKRKGRSMNPKLASEIHEFCTLLALGVRGKSCALCVSSARTSALAAQRDAGRWRRPRCDCWC